MKLLITLLFLLPLTACVGTVQTYPGEPRDISQIAILKGGSADPSGDTFWPGNKYWLSFVSYRFLEEGKKPESVRVGNAFIGNPREIHVAPGKYLLLTRCDIQNQYAFPSVSVDAVAGMTYEIRCEPVANQLSTVKAGVVSSGKTQPPKKE